MDTRELEQRIPKVWITTYGPKMTPEFVRGKDRWTPSKLYIDFEWDKHYPIGDAEEMRTWCKQCSTPSSNFSKKPCTSRKLATDKELLEYLTFVVDNIATLRSQLAEARKNAVEEAAKAVKRCREKISITTDENETVKRCVKAIRALASTTDGGTDVHKG